MKQNNIIQQDLPTRSIPLNPEGTGKYYFTFGTSRAIFHFSNVVQVYWVTSNYIKLDIRCGYYEINKLTVYSGIQWFL